jgi:hypothetical protein
MRRYALLLVGLALVSSACAGTLGRTIPECDSAMSTMVLAVQSVPDSHFVSCIVGLKAGWKYQDLEAESGQSFYTLDSDRMGTGFVRVENVLSCDVGDAVLARSFEPDIELWKDVVSETTVDVVIVPEGSTAATNTRMVEIVLELDDVEIKGRTVVVSPSVSDESTSARIDAAAASGAHVIVISIRDAEEGTLTLLIQGAPNEIQVDSIDEALDEIEDAETQSSYVGNWYYVFDGGCVVYTFDAEGSGVATIERDIEIALWLFDAEELRQVARDMGYRVS